MDMSWYTKTEEELNEVFDHGVFNTIVYGYLALTLQEMGFAEEKVNEAIATCSQIFDDVFATEARDAIR